MSADLVEFKSRGDWSVNGMEWGAGPDFLGETP